MKIAIVGAGICGLYLSWKLSQKGHQALVFEKKEGIGKEVCSGLFSQRLFDFIPEAKKLVQNEIKEAVIHFPKKTIKIKFSKPFFVLSHYELDNLLAELAQKAGTRILLSQPQEILPQNFDRIIGCDGPKSIIRKKLNLPEPKFRLGIQGFLEKKDKASFVETWPTKAGFIWKIPRGNETEYGIMEEPQRAGQYLEKFLKEKKINLQRKKAAIIPQGLIIPSNQKITLCGDACGLTKPWSGGGVVWSLISADMLLRNFPDFVKYKKEVKRFFLPKIIFSKIIIKLGYLIGERLPWILPKEVKIESDFLV